MRAVLFLFFATLSFFAAGQSDDRVKLRDLQAATGDGQVIQSLNDTSRWVVPPWADSISVLQDSIVVLYSDGSEVARDTVGPFGGATTVYYQTLRDDGTPVTQRDAINFVATSTVATTLTDDAGNGETEVALSVPTGGITSTQILDGTITTSDLAFTVNSGSGAANHVTYWSGTNTLNYDNGEFTWDATNNRMGVGVTSPTSKIDITNNSLGVTYNNNNGLSLNNTTAAAAGAQQISPSILFRGNGWKTNATAASRTVDFQIYNLPVQGSANPSGLLMFQSSINGGGYNEHMALTTAGRLGIGTTSPAAQLHVTTSGLSAGYFRSTDDHGFEAHSGGVAGRAAFIAVSDAATANSAIFRAHASQSEDIWRAQKVLTVYSIMNKDAWLGLNTGAVTLTSVLQVKGTGATSATSPLLIENSAGTDILYADDSGQVAVGTNIPARKFHVAGEARITDLTTDAPTRIVGADADGDLGEITVSSELLLSGGVLSVGTLSHAALSDLGSPEDDHDQYLNIFGRAGGQIVYGATGASENLDLNSTTNATKGNILLQDEGGNVIIGGAATASRLRMMEASGSGTNYTEFVTQAQAANVTYTLPADDGDAGEQLQTNGSGSLSWQPPGGDIDFEVYDVAGSYTYNIPTGAKAIDIITIGGGGGGGSGRKGATTDANTGGGGGGGGGYSRVLFVVSQLSASSLDIDVGAGGTGGASVSTSSTNGSGGADGEITTVYCSGFLLCAGGPGDGGGGGSTGASTGGVDATIGDVLGQNGGSCATDGVAAAGDASNNKAPGGGGSGGGIPAGGTPAKNGSRSAKYNYGQDQITNNGTVASPDAGDATANAQQITGGGGGAGGASSIASSGGDGGDGIMGSGGGGGGAALNGVGDSGAGGAGGTGWVLLIVKY